MTPKRETLSEGARAQTHKNISSDVWKNSYDTMKQSVIHSGVNIGKLQGKMLSNGFVQFHFYDVISGKLVGCTGS